MATHYELHGRKKNLFRKKKTCSAEVTPFFTNILVSIILVVKWPDFFGVCGSDDDVYHNVEKIIIMSLNCTVLHV